MREIVDAERARRFLTEYGRAARKPTVVYLTGGASAVLEGWRESTVDLDLKFVPDGEAFNLLPGIKDRLRLNIELASPDHFLPALPGWEDRSPLIQKTGQVEYRHYDFYSQALAKIERGLRRDVADVHAMLARGLVEPVKLRDLAQAIVPELPRFPAVDPQSFVSAVDACLADFDAPSG